MATLGQQQIDFSEQQYAEYKPIADKIAAQQIAAQNQQMTQAQDYYNYQQSTFRPVEQGLVADAQTFNTTAYQEQLASQASAAAGQAFGITDQMNTRSMASMGVNPNSGAATSMRTATGLQQGASRAAAMTGARTQADQLGWARRMDATGLGRNLSGASLGAYSGATSAGTAGANTGMSAANQMSAGMSSGAGMIQGGLNTQMTGLTSVLGSQTSVYNTAQSQPDTFGTIAGIAGQVGAAYATGGMSVAAKAAGSSDRRLKQDITRVGTDDRTNLPIYEFAYKAEPAIRWRGVMADEVMCSYPEAVTKDTDGFYMVNYAMLGMKMVEA